MNDLKRSNLLKKENLQPNAASIAQQTPPLPPAQMMYSGIDLSQLPPYLSMMITNPGAKEDIMNMGMDELETLK
jgi:hypothetical protein